MPRKKPPSTEPDPRPRRVRRTPEAARELILEAARGLIAERGPDAVSLKDIGAAVGVSHTLVVHYFGGYEPLVQEVLKDAVTRFRALLIARVESGEPLDPASWIAMAFDQLRDRTASRLLLWALLSGRLEGPDAFFRTDKGLAKVADALEKRLIGTFGPAAPERATLELTLVIAIAASWGYALGAPALWGGLGREPSQAKDDAARDWLGAALVQSTLGPHRRA
ncbi:MAG: TetR/AcrR family transcriptional regulator [Myxococcota bacterium]